MPAAVQRVLALCDRPGSDLEEIASAIATDASLASEVMRLASSAVYARAHPVRDLRSATLRIGLAELRTMASAMAMLVAFRSERELALSIHESAVLSGNLACAFAEARGHSAPRRAFLAGLLSEIGALAIMAIDDDAYIRLRSAAGLDMAHRAQLETAQYGATSWEIGGLLLERNSLPAEVCRAVRGERVFSDLSSVDLAGNLVLTDATTWARAAAGVMIAAGKVSDPTWVEQVGYSAERFGLSLAVERLEMMCMKAASNTQLALAS